MNLDPATRQRTRATIYWRLFQTIALIAILIFLALSFWRLNTPPPPDPRLIDVSVRSTLFALPTQTPNLVIATQVVEVTRVVSVTVVATATPTATLPPASESIQDPASVALSSDTRSLTAPSIPAPELASQPIAAAAEAPPPDPAPQQPAPIVNQAPAPPPACPASSDRSFDLIPIEGGTAEHPDSIHGDLNLGVRGWSPVAVELGIVNINGPTDGDPPQLATIFLSGQAPPFTSAWQVYDWNWGNGPHGSRGELMSHREVMLLGMGTSAGEAITIPNRDAEIYGGGYKALVLYAEPHRITLNYTREDSVANGYAIHIENLCVDPNLIAAYNQANANGRWSLPALRNDDILGTAGLGEIRVAVRDRGAFLDPRSRKDWWRGF